MPALVTTLPSGSEAGKGVCGEIRTELARWTAPYAATSALAKEVWFRLARCSPARLQDPLFGDAEWEAFADRLREAVEALVAPGVHLCLIPGVLSGMPLQYVFGANHPLSYAPSLAAAGALRRRHMALPESDRWRPRTFHDFVVWKVTEREENILQFKESAATLQAAIEALGCDYQASIGDEATREKLLESLSQVDCLRLSCHGRADSYNLRFDLLVADKGWLPPGHPAVLAGQMGERFLVGWQELSRLPSAPPVVFSAACASGLTVTVRGGERIGLERSFLRAGSVAYVAPQWPVPIAVIQPLINRVIVGYLRASKRSLADIIFEATAAAISEGVALRVARSLVVHGDWL